jgi:hypothetical protein
MKVKELIDALNRCDGENDVVSNGYYDLFSVREETVFTYKDDKRHCNSNVVLEFSHND